MATVRKPARCDCGATLKTYVRIAKGKIVTEEAAGCPKCGAVYTRPTCYAKTTLELCRDAKLIVRIRKAMGIKVGPVAIEKMAASEVQ